MRGLHPVEGGLKVATGIIDDPLTPDQSLKVPLLLMERAIADRLPASPAELNLPCQAAVVVPPPALFRIHAVYGHG